LFFNILNMTPVVFLDVLIIVFYCFACIGVGFLCFRLIRLKVDFKTGVSAVAYVASSFLFGQAILASVWLLGALGSFFSRYYIVSILLFSALYGMLATIRNIHAVNAQVVSHVTLVRQMTWPYRLVASLTILTFVLHAYAAYILHPTVDADGYYLLYPKIIATAQRLTAFKGWPEVSYIGLLGEMHFAALLSLGRLATAKLFVWPVSVAAALLLAGIAGLCRLSALGKWISWTILLTSTAFIFLISDGKPDLFAAASGLGVIYWALQTDKTISSSTLRLIGLLTGFAVIAKHSYVICLVPAVTGLVVWRTIAGNDVLRQRLLRALFVCVQIGLWMIPAIIPHMVKNGVLFHEPIAPFLFLSGSRAWLDFAWFSPEDYSHILLTYPFAISFGVYPGQYGNLSPLVLSFLPLIVLLHRPFNTLKKPLIQVTVAGLLGISLWLLFGVRVHAPRYILVSFLLLIPIAAWGASHLLSAEPKSRLIKFCILFCLLFSLGLILLSQFRLLFQGYVGGLDWGAPVSKVEGAHYRPIQKVNQLFPPGARVFLYGSYTVHLRGDLLQCISTGHEAAKHAEIQSPIERWSYLYDRGFSYVIIRGNPYVKDPRADELFALDQKPAWLDIVEVLDENGLRVYQLISRDPARRPQFTTRQIQPPAWDIVKYE
jgi:hypothetical protein